VRQETWSYSIWIAKCSIHYAYWNFKGNIVKQLMLKYSSAPSSQGLQDIYCQLGYFSCIFGMIYVWSLLLLVFLGHLHFWCLSHFNRIKIFLFLIYALHSAFLLETHKIDRSKQSQNLWIIKSKFNVLGQQIGCRSHHELNDSKAVAWQHGTTEGAPAKDGPVGHLHVGNQPATTVL